MRGGRVRFGVVLVTVLLLSLATWLALSASLFALRLQHEVAVATRDHSRASSAALHLTDRFRARDWWAATTPDDALTGGSPSCTWAVTELERDAQTARYEVAVTLGRARVTLDATAHRSLTPP